jgi:Pput_2613-like deaminase/Pretoxin HINT domain
VLADNPRTEEFDDSFAEPVQSEWARVSFLIVRNDLSLVEAEFIRPRDWIESLGLVKGARIDLAVPELEIDGLAEVTAVRDCPPIADGEGRVVTGKFVTRDVANVVRITLANGTEIRATDVHPIWSVDREDWVPAGKLEPGEQVDTLTGPVAVTSVEPLERHPAVYNLEVHGEHVYRIAVDGVLVHNAGPGHYAEWALFGPKGALIRAGDEISGLDFALPKGWKLSFPDQSWHGHTEGKLLSDLLQDGLLKPGRILNIEGQLPPCTNCQSLMKLISQRFGMIISYQDDLNRTWTWINGILET